MNEQDSVFVGEYVYEDEGYDFHDDDHLLSRDYPGYTVADLLRQVTFIRPDGDTEGKDVYWCLGNSFREVKDGVWSGEWCEKYGCTYPTSDDHVNTELARKRTALERRLEHVVDKNVDSKVFQSALNLKNTGNAYFAKGDYQRAIQCYKKATKKLGLGALLSGEQREEMVKILSNQAECFLRLEWYVNAQGCATEALTLDAQHEKSLVRRAKATFYGAEHDAHGINPFATTQALHDLDKVIGMNGRGAKEAKTLKEAINQELERDIARMNHGRLKPPSRKQWHDSA